MRIHLTIAVALMTSVSFAAGPKRHFSDAPLRSVTFASRDEGWAVGDDGVIWQTIDGGVTWDWRDSGTRASLRAVQFLTPYTGWVAGREELPNGGGSAGVLLFTTDGGLKWTRVAAGVMPGLHAVKFFNDRDGIVAGEGSDTFGSGAFVTADGGKSWRPLSGPRQPGWLCADFSDMKTGAMAGAWSSLAIVRDNVFGKSDIDTLGGRSILALKAFSLHAVAVGQGGLVLYSKDSGGAKWSYSSIKCLSRDALSNCDFNAVAHIGEHIWVAGRPGTIVLHSADYGRSWECFSTGQNMPIHGLTFLDTKTGWAVGELGTVLITEDGGKSWAVQRPKSGNRAAVMLIHSGPETIPLEVVAKLGGDEGYLTTALRVTSADPATAPMKRAGDPQHWSEAVRLAGGAAGESLWQFPVATHQTGLNAEQMIGGWDKLHGGKAGEMLLRQLVLSIRMWQPELIVTDPSGKDDSLIDVAVREAFIRAADPKSFPEQLEQLGLKPWEVKKLYGLSLSESGRNMPEHVSLDCTQPMPRAGDSPRDVAAAASLLLLDSPIPLPNVRTFHLRESRLPDAGQHVSLMEGINLAFGGTARRILPPSSEDELAWLKEREKSSREVRNFEALAKPQFQPLGGPDRLLGQIEKTLKSLPPDRGAAAAFALADRYAKAGQWHMAQETYLLMVNRYPASPLSLEAYRWLARYSSSSEARRRHELGQFELTTQYDVVQTPGQGSEKDPVRQTAHGGIEKNEGTRLLGNWADARNWYQGALAMEPRLYGYGPLVQRDPALQVCLLSAKRNLGNAEAARQWYAKYVADTAENVGDSTRPDVWREIAMSEMWLTNRTARAPRPVGLCRMTMKRPNLDGKLDDDCWNGVKPLTLKTASGELGADYQAKAYFAYDSDFLYVAVECKHPAGKQVPKVEKRERDMDLRNFDRVSIMLDLDRDYQTYYRFQIDQRGALAEDCWGDSTWNPKWYVAVNSDETGWTAEAAIPRSELTGDPITLGKVWACNITRVVPGKGVQSWSLPADVDPRPEGMGLLIFNEK